MSNSYFQDPKLGRPDELTADATSTNPADVKGQRMTVPDRAFVEAEWKRAVRRECDRPERPDDDDALGLRRGLKYSEDKGYATQWLLDRKWSFVPIHVIQAPCPEKSPSAN